MSEYVVTDTELTAVADAIRTKGGTQANLEWYADFVSAIGAISGGGDAKIYEFIDEDYYMDSTGTICVVGGMTYTKTNADPAFVAYWHKSNNYTGPVLVSETEDGAKYTAFGNTYNPSSVTIDGKSWYVSADTYYQYGDLTKSGGFAQKLSGSYASISSAAEALLALAFNNLITENGTYNVPSGYDGFGAFEVDVPPDLESLSVTKNGTYTSQNKDGFSVVTVNVSGGGGSSNILSGTETPTSAVGNNGAIYLTYNEIINVPTGYTVLSYLGFTTGTYINVNIVPTDHSLYMVVEDLSYGNDKHWFGTDSAYNGVLWHFTTFNNKYYWGTGTGESNGGSWQSGTHILKYNWGNNDEVILDGTVIGYSTNVTTIYNLFLGRRKGTANASDFRIQIMILTDKSTGTVVRKMIPVKRNSDSVIGLYDLVNDVLYTNSGYNSFSAGSEVSYIGGDITQALLKVNGAWQDLIGSDIDDVNTGGSTRKLPSEYQEVEYVKVSSAGPYIDTGVKSSSTAYFEITAKYDDTPGNNHGIFGTMHGGQYVINSWDGTSYLCAGSDNGNLSSAEQLQKHDYKADDTGIYIDETRKGNVNWSSAQNSKNYHLFAFIYQDDTIYKTANARIYSCKIWTGGFLVRNLIPCYRKADNVIGFYDINNDEFLTNDGTGSFEKGANV